MYLRRLLQAIPDPTADQGGASSPEVLDLADEWGIKPPENDAAQEKDRLDGINAVEPEPKATTQTSEVAEPPAGETPAVEESPEESIETWKARVKTHEADAAAAREEAKQIRERLDRFERMQAQFLERVPPVQQPQSQQQILTLDQIRVLAQTDPNAAFQASLQRQAAVEQYQYEQLQSQVQTTKAAEVERARISIREDIKKHQEAGYKLADPDAVFYAHVYGGVERLLDAVKASHFANYKRLAAARGTPTAQVGGAQRIQPPGVNKVLAPRGTPRQTGKKSFAETIDSSKSFDQLAEEAEQRFIGN